MRCEDLVDSLVVCVGIVGYQGLVGRDCVFIVFFFQAEDGIRDRDG